MTILSRLDYGGISVLIFGSGFPIIYYSYACRPVLVQKWAWVSVYIVLNLGCFVTSLIPKFDSAKFRPLRGGMFILAGASIIAVFIAIRNPANPYKIETELGWFSGGGAIYIVGASLYISRLPERCKPGMFDLCGASH
jgi:adiponectin receptor